MTRAAEMSRPSSVARARTEVSSPRMVRSATCRCSRVEAARRMRSSVPSGSTMCLRSARARERSSCSNMSGVTTSGRSTWRASSRAAPSMFCSNRARAVSTLRCESTVRRPRTFAAADAERKVPRPVWMIGTDGSMSSSRRETCSGGYTPPLRMIPASDGNDLAVCATSSPRRTSVRSPGVMTTAPSTSFSRRFSNVIAPTSTSNTSRPSRVSSPLTSCPPTAFINCPTVGAVRNGSVGTVHTGVDSSVKSAVMLSSFPGWQRLITVPRMRA